MHEREDGERWRVKVRQSRSESVHPYMLVLYCLPCCLCVFFPHPQFLPHHHPEKDCTRGDEERIGWGSRMCDVHHTHKPRQKKIQKTDCRHIRSKWRNDNITYTPFSLLYLRGKRLALTSAPRSIRYRTTATLALLQLAAWIGNTPLTTESIACPLSRANLTRPK